MAKFSYDDSVKIKVGATTGCNRLLLTGVVHFFCSGMLEETSSRALRLLMRTMSLRMSWRTS
jgi:hypothetical protein